MWIYITAGTLIILSVVLKMPSVKGWLGEQGVNFQLKKLNKPTYQALNNVVIPSDKGHTTQIDHLVISKYGIFVIETKNYTGWILGSEKSAHWTQVIYKRREKFHNPLRQNYGHIKALQQLLHDFPEIVMIPVICFSNQATLKVDVSNFEVIYTTQLVKTIKKYDKLEISDQDVIDIYNKITQQKLTGKDVNKKHVDGVKNQIIDKEIQVANNECPRCGGELTMRQGKYGRFKGCANFPKCRFTYQL